jgi:hypothetical protein
MLETLSWIAETEAQRALEQQPQREKRIATLALVSALLLLIYWLTGRKKDKTSS